MSNCAGSLAQEERLETEELESAAAEPVHLERKFGLLQATALNMSNMVGIGPFITIPVLMSALGGPQSMLGWAVAVLIAIPDGMVWAELGAAMPGSGGSYVYLREAFGRHTFGRLMAFLFIWQFIISGPLEIASGYIGFGNYAGYLWHNMQQAQKNGVIIAVGILTVLLLYRRIHSVAALTVSLWVGMLLTIGAVIVSGFLHFNPHIAFDFPSNTFKFTWGFVMGLGLASRTGMYDYLGYYDICYIGDEVKQPERVIPRSILISLVAIALIYLAINLSIIGVVPWREFVPSDKHQETADFVAAIFMQKLYGSGVAKVFTVMVLWTALASVFALLLGYSRVVYAAAKDGYFFKLFSRLHPTGHFPYVSLLLLGLLSIGCAFFPLDAVINALLVTRIVIQFMGQIVAVALIRKYRSDMNRPFKMWLFPLTGTIAFVGWAFLFATTDLPTIKLGVGSLAAGILAFLIWSRLTGTWPFKKAETEAAAA